MFACVYPPGDDKGGDVYFNPGFPWGNHTITCKCKKISFFENNKT